MQMSPSAGTSWLSTLLVLPDSCHALHVCLTLDPFGDVISVELGRLQDDNVEA